MLSLDFFECKIPLEEIGNFVGSWVAIVDKSSNDDETLIGKITKVEHYKTNNDEGLYISISGTDFEFSFLERWANIYKVNINLDGLQNHLKEKFS